MAIHDAWARTTPYELFLPGEDFADERFAALEAEAEERGGDLSDPDRFVLFMAAGETLRELRGPDEHPERIRQHGLLLFHAYHFRKAGEPVWLLPTPAVRYLIEGFGASEASPRPPGAAGYLQLPQHLFWARPEGGGAGEGGQTSGGEPGPESVDGIFWVVAGERLHVLTVLGLRGDRPGFAVAPLPPVPAEDTALWAATDMRGEGEEDFRSDMPGAELESLYELRTAGEILKLLARAFHLMTAGTPRRETPAEPEEQGPRPSRLPFHRISLD
jgi:hypothetical protein